MKNDSIILQAKNEVAAERNEKLVAGLKILYRQLSDAEDVAASIRRKIAVAEAKIRD